MTTKRKSAQRTTPARRRIKRTSVAKAARSKAAPARPGVIATIVELISAPNGATKNEMVPVLAKKFPDRNPDSMRNTIGLNMHLYAKRKAHVEGRGLVYYGKIASRPKGR